MALNRTGKSSNNLNEFPIVVATAILGLDCDSPDAFIAEHDTGVVAHSDGGSSGYGRNGQSAPGLPHQVIVLDGVEPEGGTPQAQGLTHVETGSVQTLLCQSAFDGNLLVECQGTHGYPLVFGRQKNRPHVAVCPFDPEGDLGQRKIGIGDLLGEEHVARVPLADCNGRALLKVNLERPYLKVLKHGVSESLFLVGCNQVDQPPAFCVVTEELDPVGDDHGLEQVVPAVELLRACEVGEFGGQPGGLHLGHGMSPFDGQQTTTTECQCQALVS